MGWGNSSASTFKKTTLREATSCDVTVTVHKVLKPLVERVLAGWATDGVDVSSVRENEKDALRRSFICDVDPTEEMADRADTFGFSAHGHIWEYKGSFEWAEAKDAELLEADLSEISVAAFEPKKITGEKLGSRELVKDDEGTDVVALQWFLDVDRTGTFDKATERSLSSYQRTHNLTVTGSADREFWAYLIPRVIRWKRMGEAGPDIRLIQSALCAFGYQAGPVTGRYGVITNRALQNLRTEIGVTGATKIDSNVWGAMFDLQFQYVRQDIGV